MDEQTYYEILGISVNADTEEIQKAYSEMVLIYDTDSLSSYSLFSDTERKKILNRAKTAFDVLMDDQKRNEYDQSLSDKGHKADHVLKREKRKQVRPLLSYGSEEISRQSQKTIKQKMMEKDISALKTEIHSRASLSGSDLKQFREAVQVKLKDIFTVTRVPLAVLSAIEADDIEQLPSGVFLKGYLKSYAECLLLDSSIVVAGYLKHLDSQT